MKEQAAFGEKFSEMILTCELLLKAPDKNIRIADMALNKDFYRNA